MITELKGSDMEMSTEFEKLVPSFVHIVNRHCDESYFIPPSVRDFHNFMFIMSGEGYCVKDREQLPVSGGTLIYNPPGQRFGYRTSKTDRMHIVGINVYLASAAVNRGKWSWEETKRLPLQHITRIQEVNGLLKQLERLAASWDLSKLNFNMRCRCIFMGILLELVRWTKEVGRDPAERLIQPAIHFIQQHYMEEITLQMLCSETGLTPSYFGRLFKQVMGDTPITYVHWIRTEKAKELLGIGFKVTEIAELVGFQDPFYFSKVFKKMTGASPREYVKSNAGLL